MGALPTVGEHEGKLDQGAKKLLSHRGHSSSLEHLPVSSRAPDMGVGMGVASSCLPGGLAGLLSYCGLSLESVKLHCLLRAFR